MNIADSRIIITGAGSGFGKQMTLQLAAQQARVVAIDIDQQALKKLKDECDDILTWCCDVSNPVEIEKTVDEIFVELGGLEVLINNAGIMKNAPLINILNKEERKHSIALWEHVISVNQNSVFFMTRACVDGMIKKRNKGLILNISSIAARGNIGQTAYSASKAAVEAMTMVWAKELGRYGIRSVAIAPGFIDTSGTHDALEEKMLAYWIEKTPLRRTGNVEEIVKTVSFVIENDFVNGEVINVNGGLNL